MVADPETKEEEVRGILTQSYAQRLRARIAEPQIVIASQTECEDPVSCHARVRADDGSWESSTRRAKLLPMPPLQREYVALSPSCNCDHLRFLVFSSSNRADPFVFLK